MITISKKTFIIIIVSISLSLLFACKKPIYNLIFKRIALSNEYNKNVYSYIQRPTTSHNLPEHYSVVPWGIGKLETRLNSSNLSTFLAKETDNTLVFKPIDYLSSPWENPTTSITFFYNANNKFYKVVEAEIFEADPEEIIFDQRHGRFSTYTYGDACLYLIHHGDPEIEIEYDNGKERIKLQTLDLTKSLKQILNRSLDERYDFNAEDISELFYGKNLVIKSRSDVGSVITTAIMQKNENGFLYNEISYVNSIIPSE